MRATTTTHEYFKNIWDSLATTWGGMRITGKYLMQKPITVQYPDERLPIPDRYRGIHYLEQEKCIDCLACARACPIDCIEMDAIRHGKELEWVLFTLDYQKCMFCELCVYPCPKDCIHMGTEFAFVSYDRSEFNHDLLSYKGMSREARIRKREADIKKAEKAAVKALAAAAAESEAHTESAAAPEPAAATQPEIPEPAETPEPTESSQPEGNEESTEPDEAPATASWEEQGEDSTSDGPTDAAPTDDSPTGGDSTEDDAPPAATDKPVSPF